MADQYTDEEIKEFKRIFSLFEYENDGNILSKDIISLFQYLGQTPTETELMEILNQCDPNHSGKVNFIDFLGLKPPTKAKKTNEEADLIEKFIQFDKNKSGTVSKGEMKSVLFECNQSLTDEDIEELLRELEVYESDDNFPIDYREIVKILFAK